MIYLYLKHLHVTAVVVTLALFTLRGIWVITDSPRLQQRWVRILPHANDTVLLAAAVAMAVITHQYPFQQPWLTAKLLALLAYIGLGTVAIRRGRTKRVRVAAWVAALAVFGYIVAVALTRSPLPFTGS